MSTDTRLVASLVVSCLCAGDHVIREGDDVEAELKRHAQHVAPEPGWVWADDLVVVR